jgi:hypothetical protein
MKRSPMKRTNGFKKPRKAMKGIRIDLADKYFSLFIRYRDRWTCQRCGTQYEVGSQGLHNSHFWSRGRESTRFDPVNCVAHCFHCHTELGGNPELHRTWKLKQIGQAEYDRLMIRAETRQKKDRIMAAIVAKKLYEREKERYERTNHDDGT